MKVIDYTNTTGTFKIKYLEDNEFVSGSINVDSSSLNIDAVVTKLIINNSVGDIIKVEDIKPYEFEIVEKNIKIVYKDVSEFDYFQQFKTYNERIEGIESRFINVSEGLRFKENDILFQFYYKSAESDEKDTASYILKNYFKKGARLSDDVSPKGYYYEFDLLCKVFKTSFLAKNSMQFEDYYICSVPHKDKDGNDTLDDIVKELTKRDVRKDLNYYLNTNQLDAFKDKKIIIIDSVINDSNDLINYSNILKENGANEVLLFAFAKTVVKGGKV